MPSTRPTPRRFAALVCIAGIAPASAAQNYAANGNFDTDLSSWQASGTPQPAWTMADYQGRATSGSAAFESDAANASTRTYPLMQCVTPPPGPYTFTARAFLPSGQTAGRLVMSYSALQGVNCTGGSNGSGGVFLQQKDVWQQQSMTFNVANLPGASVLLMLGIEKDAAGGTLVGRFDGIEMISDVLFASAFES